MQNSEALFTGIEKEAFSVTTEKERTLIPNTFLNVNLKKIRMNHRYQRVKRILDIVGATCGLFGLGLLYPFIAAGIKLSSRGPIMFIQDRTGRNGKVFRCYKFRTMHTGITKKNEDDEPIVTEIGDRRIFKFGEFLRTSNLDELPQLINVLKGDMSLVGPRPLEVKECRYWRSKIPNFELRYAVKPGLTGWAQVTGYRGGTLDIKHMAFRLKRDFKYIENYCLLLDFNIIYRTIKHMIHQKTQAH